MLINILFGLIFVVLLADFGLKAAVCGVAALFFFFLGLSFLREMVFITRYRREYIACAAAVKAQNEVMADEVNRWTHHYYVHKSFRMEATRGKLDCGYDYSIRDRPRNGNGGLGGDSYISFG